MLIRRRGYSPWTTGRSPPSRDIPARSSWSVNFHMTMPSKSGVLWFNCLACGRTGGLPNVGKT